MAKFKSGNTLTQLVSMYNIFNVEIPKALRNVPIAIYGRKLIERFMSNDPTLDSTINHYLNSSDFATDLLKAEASWSNQNPYMSYYLQLEDNGYGGIRIFVDMDCKEEIL